MPGSTRRFFACLGIVVLTALAAEGLASLLQGQGFLRRIPGLQRGQPASLVPTFAPEGTGTGLLGSKGNPGPFWLHPDPRVGLALHPQAEMVFARGRARSNHLGLRRRPGGEPPAGALRIAIAGASIPFGYGLGDAETLAHQLERILADLWTGTGPPPASLTVAVPRWSHRNAVHFLLDHWSEIQPDIILYMPFVNDMADTPIATTDGYRRVWPDGLNPRPLASVDQGQVRQLMSRARSRLEDPDTELGAWASASDLSPESRRRYDENARSIRLLARRARESGARLALLRYRDSAHDWHLLERLLDQGEELPVVPFFRTIKPWLRLPWDGHPNAETQRAMALWSAEALLELGWLGPEAGGPLPPVEKKYQALRSTPQAPDDVRRLSSEHRARSRKLLRSEVSFETWQGLLQVYGGLGLKAQATTGLTVLLAVEGRRLDVRLRGLAEDLGIYPLKVRVEAAGHEMGEVEVQRDMVAEGSFPLPDSIPLGEAIEVRLLPETWGLLQWDGIAQVGSFLPLSIAAPGD